MHADQPEEVIGMMWDDDGGWGWGGWLAMTMVMVLLWTLVIVGIVALVHYLTGAHRGHQPGPPPPSSERGWGGRRAEDLLAERFARGEIDEDEYRRRLALLREQG
ncbi:SHOCT domain-containing protein [Streptomyces sp. NPDC054841]